MCNMQYVIMRQKKEEFAMMAGQVRLASDDFCCVHTKSKASIN